MMPDAGVANVVTQSLIAWWVFFTLVGACVGSFLNVVVYRLPEGVSIVYPPSRCPKCRTNLAWYDNVPVLGWLCLGGKCRYCKAAISVQYPLVEAATAVLFAAVFWADYYSGWYPLFIDFGFQQTWPMFLVQLTLVGALIAATLIDARLFIIPLPIPWLVTGVAVIVLPVATVFLPQVQMVTPGVSPRIAAEAVAIGGGGVVGLMIANVLLRLGWIPYSFNDPAVLEQLNQQQQQIEQQQVQSQQGDKVGSDDQAAWLAYPHPRREVLKEIIFLAWPLVGMVVGWWWLTEVVRPHVTPYWAMQSFAGMTEPTLQPWLTVLGGVLCGYLVGGGIVWAVRIGGTLGFGKEAMGLGDVHLLAAIGAVMGWRASLIIFFVAPFLGLAVHAVLLIIGQVSGYRVRVVPYGPYLAAAAVLLLLFSSAPLEKFGIL